MVDALDNTFTTYIPEFPEPMKFNMPKLNLPKLNKLENV